MRPSRQQKQLDRRAYVLIAVLMVVVVLSLAAYRFTDSMTSEFTVAVRTSEAAQVKAFAASGVHYAAGMLADPSTMANTLSYNPFDNETSFSNVSVNDQTSARGGGRFCLIAVSDTFVGTGEGRYLVKYGVMDESAKLNINSLMQLDQTGQVLHDALMKLPNMTEDVADAIVDWVDMDDTSRAAGAESAYYSGLSPPYRAKNGPINSIDELLLVRGVTPQLLFGNDRNRNGKLDTGENDGNDFGRGWSEFLTVYGRELDTDLNGNPRINLNDTNLDAATLSQQLTAAVGQEMSDYILAGRLFGTASSTPSSSVVFGSLVTSKATTTTSKATTTTSKTTTSSDPDAVNGTVKMTFATVPATPAAQTIVVGPAQLRVAVQAAITAGTKMKSKINSASALNNTQVTLPKAANTPPNTVAPTLIVKSPFNDPVKLKEFLPKLLEYTTTRTDFEIVPRINVNNAPPEVLLGLPGLTQTDVDAMTNARGALDPTDPATITGAWLVTQANMTAAKFLALEKYVTGRTMTYRVHSVGYFGRGGPRARIEAVIDVNQNHPRIVYYRDVTDLGRGFDLPR